MAKTQINTWFGGSAPKASAPAAPPARSDLDVQFDAWKAKPNMQTLNSLLDASMPTINAAATSYARGQQDQVMSQAKKLAIKAFHKYRPDSGTQLRTYIMTQLQPLYRVAHKRRSSVRIPEQASRELYSSDLVRKELTSELGREPSDDELADRVGISRSRMRFLDRYNRPERYEGSAFDEQGVPVFVGTEDASAEQIWIEFVYHDLGPIDKKILEWKTGLNGKPIHATQEIAKRLNMTPSAVSQRTAKIQAKLSEAPDQWEQ